MKGELISTPVVDRIRRRYVHMTKQLQGGVTPPSTEIAAYLADTRQLIEAYEAATNRIRGAMFTLEGERVSS
jgi:hypothetical protein